MHLRDEDSVLFLILPKRCLSSPFFSSPDDFLSLLQVVFGLRLLEPPHSTPKVAFFVLQLPRPAWSLPSTSPSWLECVRLCIEHNVAEYQADLAAARRSWQPMLWPFTSASAPRGGEEKSQTSAEQFSITLGTSLCTSKCSEVLKKALG